MSSGSTLTFVGLVGMCLSASASFAQNRPNKKDALAALDEVTLDNSRFERIAALARSLGVSDARIVSSRFIRTIYTGDLEGMKKLLPEFEKALATMPADEADSGMPGMREIVSQVRKTLASGDQSRIRALLEKYQGFAEADSIQMDLRRIDAAVDMCAIEKNLKEGNVVPAKEWLKHVKQGCRLQETGTDIFGVAYGDQIVDQTPKPNASSLAKVSKYVPPDYFDITSPANRR